MKRINNKRSHRFFLRTVHPFAPRSFQFVAILSLIVSLGFGQEDFPSGSIVGTVNSSEGPLTGVQVWLEGSEVGDITDSLGMYRLEILSPGDYQVVFRHIGYKEETRKITVVEAREEQIINIELNQVAVEMDAILVTPKEEGFDPSGITARLTTRMIQEAPGAAQDIFLVLQTLPGVSSGGDDSKLFVRGGRPEENLIVYDGATIPNPFHFDFIGGGFYSIFNSALVENVEFYSGWFPARYGDRLSSVMIIENREANRERTRAEISLSMSDLSGMVEAPISSTAATILSIRRSYFDLLLNESGFGGKYDLLPFFYDVNSRTDVFLADRHRLSINLLYSREEMSGEFDEPHWEGMHNWSSENWTAAMRLRSLFSESFASDLNIYWSEGSNRASHADDIGTENTRKGEVAIKEDIAIRRGVHEFHLGMWLVQDRGEMRINLPLDLAYNFEPLAFESNGNTTKLALYAGDTWRVTDKISLNLGVRGDHIIISSETILSPRLNLVVNPTETVQLSANYGLYTQSPPAYELKNNIQLRSRQSHSWGIGISGTFSSDAFWSFEGYRKQLSSLMTIDSVGNFTSEGEGSTTGYELYVQRKSGDSFIGWGSVTYSVAKRMEQTAEEITLFDYDQTYMVTAVGQYRPSKKWKLSLRFRYATGRPYTPAEGGWYNADAQRFFPVVGERNSSRYPPYHRLDIRVARYFPQILGGLTVYLETINTYDRDNVAYYIWSEDFSSKRNFTVFPFIPVIGIDLML